jgi:tetratricopeptide (TPR) repeat protein
MRSPRTPTRQPLLTRLDTPPLAGRNVEQDLLLRHLEGGGPPVLVLAGEPGMGKTRLLDEAIRRASMRGWTTLHGGCRRHGGQESYAPILDALEDHIRRQRRASLRSQLRGCMWLVRLLPELAHVGIGPLPIFSLPPERERRLVFGAVARFLYQIAGPAGTLLVLDDLQWAGSDAIDLLVTLAQASADESTPVRVIGAYRHTDLAANAPLATALADLASAGLALQHDVRPLALGDARRLLEGVLSNHAALTLEQQDLLVRRTGGVPFFIVSCAQGLRDGGQRDDGDNALPWTLVQSIRQRIAALPVASQEVLQAAATIGRDAPRALLACALSQPDQVLLEAVEAACAARLLEERGDHVGFVHDVIWEVVETDLSATRRALLHRKIALALEHTRDEHAAELLAHHFERAGLPERALPYLELAGDRARARLAHGTAADHYRALANRLEQIGRSQDAARIREKLGAVLTAMGQYGAALHALELAVVADRAAGDVESVGRVSAQVGQVYMRRGAANEGIERLRELLPLLQTAGPSHGLAALCAALAHLLFVSGRYAEQIEIAIEAATVARSIGDDRILAEAEGRHGVALLILGRLDEALAMLQAAAGDATRAGDLDSLCRALSNIGVIHFIRGEFTRARPYRERALATARLQGDPFAIARTLANRGEGALYAGQWSNARADFTLALAQIAEIDENGAAAYPMLDLATLCLVEGHLEEMARHAGEAAAVAERSGDLQAIRWAATLLAEGDILSGAPDRAITRLDPLRDRPGLEETDVTYLLPTLAWARLEMGEQAGAEELAAHAVDRARSQRNLVILVEALRVRALVACHALQWEIAASCVYEGLALARAMPYPYAQARLLHVSSMVQEAGAMSGDASSKLLHEALALFERLGARADADRARSDLASLPYVRLLLSAGIALTPGQWARVDAAPLPPSRRGRPRVDDRRAVAAILYTLRTGCGWGKLPAAFGDGATAHRRFQQWRADGTWERISHILGNAPLSRSE